MEIKILKQAKKQLEETSLSGLGLCRHIVEGGFIYPEEVIYKILNKKDDENYGNDSAQSNDI